MKFAIIAIIAVATVSAKKEKRQKEDRAVKGDRVGNVSGPWEQQWANEWKDTQRQTKEDERYAQDLESQNSRFNAIRGWYEPAEEPMLGAAEEEPVVEDDRRKGKREPKARKEVGEWGQLANYSREQNLRGKTFDSRELYRAGRSYDTYDDSVKWGSDNYQGDYEELAWQERESGERWAPRQWFDAGRDWSAPEEPVYEEPVVDWVEEPAYNDYYDEPAQPEGSDLFFDDEPIYFYEGDMRGSSDIYADYDEYDMYEAGLSSQDQYWQEEEVAADYVPSAWEQRNMYNTYYNAYEQTAPSWDAYMPEETLQYVNDYRDNYDGRKQWWKSRDFQIDMAPVRESWGTAVQEWGAQAPTWDTWYGEQGW